MGKTYWDLTLPEQLIWSGAYTDAKFRLHMSAEDAIRCADATVQILNEKIPREIRVAEAPPAPGVG